MTSGKAAAGLQVSMYGEPRDGQGRKPYIKARRGRTRITIGRNHSDVGNGQTGEGEAILSHFWTPFPFFERVSLPIVGFVARPVLTLPDAHHAWRVGKYSQPFCPRLAKATGIW